MIAILAESKSDAEALAHIIRNHFGTRCPSLKEKGYDGCPELCRKGARDIRLFASQGATRFVVCHDSDQNTPSEIRERITTRIVRPADATKNTCIVVPVQEIESWIIADEQAVSKTIPTFKYKPQSSPEIINNPKEWLTGESFKGRSKPLYVPAVHNPRVACHLRLQVVAKKCPSFRAFLDCLGNP